MKSVITDEFESLKKSLLKEVIIFKNELLQSSVAKTADNDSERLIGHLESQILFLQRELKEKNQLLNSLLDQISKCNDIITSNQELSRNNVKPLENKTLVKQDRFIETTTTTNKESKKSGKKNELNETPSEEKSEKCTSQQNTSISGSNKNKSDKTKSDKSSASKTDNKKKNHKQKSLIILGDSMIKHVNVWEISRKLQGNCKVYVKHFSGANTKCMKDYTT